MSRERSPAPPPPPESRRQSHSDVARSLGYAKDAPTHEEIARRAYEIYLARRGAPGNPDEDWLQAERELTEGKR